jgi:acetolactate synthase-1/2/3 large subunit
LTLPDVKLVAAAYGLPTCRIGDEPGLIDRLRAILDTPGPIVCEVAVIPDEPRAPRLATAHRPDGSIVSKPLEDLWPFLDRDEFASNMMIEPLED